MPIFKMRKRRPQQLDISFGWGGWRRGAGRPKIQGRRVAVPHRARPTVRSRYPLHVVSRFVRDLRSMRTDTRAAIIRKAFVAGCKRDGFRIIDWSIQKDHLHLVVEARDKQSLARGMQGLGVRLARGLNAFLGRTGSVFAERYSARELHSPRDVRNTRAYVMNNARRHHAQRGLEWEDGTVDPYSSWAWFDGWRDCPRELVELVEEVRAGPEAERPVAEAHTWLLREGWRRHGLVRVDEVPGLRRSRWRIKAGHEPDWTAFGFE